MSKINRRKLRQLILQEMEKVKEDALVKFNNPGILSHHDDIGRDIRFSQGIKCYECGSQMYEGESSCSECGSTMSSLNECGCESCAACNSQKSYMNVADNDLNNNFIPDHLEESDIENMLLNIISDELQQPETADYQMDIKNHHGGAYMAKSQLYKVAKYAEKLYQMIPDGYDLEDWMRTKLAEIADDISDVYHALDHDKFENNI